MRAPHWRRWPTAGGRNSPPSGPRARSTCCTADRSWDARAGRTDVRPARSVPLVAHSPAVNRNPHRCVVRLMADLGRSDGAGWTDGTSIR
jgi:hypothetical protein